MPFLLSDLVVDRVDLVDEGANSAAFIELYKRKERSATMDCKDVIAKLKPEHAEVVSAEIDRLTGEIAKRDADIATKAASLEKANKDLEAANGTVADVTGKLEKAKADLATANATIETLKAKDDTCTCDGEADEKGICTKCGKKKSFDETETLKSMPAAAREYFTKMKAQKEAAEDELRKAREAKAESEAVAKAAQLKALPVSQDKLVGIVKSCSPEVFEVLTSINAALDGVVLSEVGKNTDGGSTDAWSKIDAKATEIVARDGVSKAKAVSLAIKENPELYSEYLQGGAN